MPRAAGGSGPSASHRASPPASVDSPAVRVDQVIPSLARRDAIGAHTLALRDALRATGIDSDVFYGNATPDAVAEGLPLDQLDRHPSHRRWLLYQQSIGSPVFDVLMARPEALLANYHNITPAELLVAWEPSVGAEVALGRRQLAELAPRCELAVADSHFNEAELRQAGYRQTAVVPLLIDMTSTGSAPDPELARDLAEQKEAGGSDLLFVGKVSPHKAPHDLVKMLAVLRRGDDPLARLHLVGSPLSERYRQALTAFAGRLGIAGALDLAGSVDAARLEAYYQAADAFVCASDHEGFCVPLVEAMGHGVPVVAHAAGAVPETLGTAGLLVATKQPVVFAATVARALHDVPLRRRLQAAAARRAADFDLGRSTERMVAAVRRATGA